MAIPKMLAMFRWLQVVFGFGALVGAALGALGGVGIGIMIGLLNAPKEGKQMREDIQSAISEGTKHIVAKGEQLRKNASKALSTNGDTAPDEAGSRMA